MTTPTPRPLRPPARSAPSTQSPGQSEYFIRKMMAGDNLPAGADANPLLGKPGAQRRSDGLRSAGGSRRSPAVAKAKAGRRRGSKPSTG